MSRAKDLLDAKDYSKLLRGNTSGLEAKDYNLVNLDEVVGNFRDFLVDVAGKTSRVNEQPLRQGALHAFDVSASEAQLFAQRVSKAFQHCVQKSRSATSTKKLPPATAAVVKVLLGRASQKTTEVKVAKKSSPKKPALPTKRTPEKEKPVVKTPQRQVVVEPASPVWSCPRTDRKSTERGVPVQVGSSGRTQGPASSSAKKRPASVTPAKKPAVKARRLEPADPEAPLSCVTVTTTVKSLPKRSYVQGKTGTPGAGKRLIVEFSEKRFPNHEELARNVKTEIEEKGLGYGAARALRDKYTSSSSAG